MRVLIIDNLWVILHFIMILSWLCRFLNSINYSFKTKYHIRYQHKYELSMIKRRIYDSLNFFVFFTRQFASCDKYLLPKCSVSARRNYK